jgi:hypothetical protein
LEWVVDLAGQDQEGADYERQGEDGGKVTKRTVWCPSKGLSKKKKKTLLPPMPTYF